MTEDSMQSFLANRWLLGLEIVTPNHLEEIRYRLAVKYKTIKNVEVLCNINIKEALFSIKLRKFRGFFIRKSKLEKKILIDMIELLPGYKVTIEWL